MSIDERRILFIDATSVGYPLLRVRTTHGNILQTIRVINGETRDFNTAVFERVTDRLKGINLREIYHQPLLNIDFCNNVVIYYVMRYVLNGNKIPIEMSSVPDYTRYTTDLLLEPLVKKHTDLTTCVKCGSPDVKECSACGTKYCSENCQLSDWEFHRLECAMFRLFYRDNYQIGDQVLDTHCAEKKRKRPIDTEPSKRAAIEHFERVELTEEAMLRRLDFL